MSDRRGFREEELGLLESLPAVESVGDGRIRYAKEFKVDCMSRYLSGERPVDIFRSVGLPPELIGRKRIERCIARWKHSDEIMRLAGGAGMLDGERRAPAQPGGRAEANLIRRQIRIIRRLESDVRRLLGELDACLALAAMETPDTAKKIGAAGRNDAQTPFDTPSDPKRE